jgi:hypothetical protein
MTTLKTIAAAAALAALTATPVFAQTVPFANWAASEPAAFASMYPNRDVLNGGALTPYGRLEAQGYTALEAVAIYEHGLHPTHARHAR